MHSSAACLLAAALSLGLAHQVSGDACLTSEIGIDASLGNDAADVLFGEATGQTFRADGRLIESITVWRVPYQDVNQFGMHLFVTATDSLGHPDESRILASGPEVFHLYGDGVNPIEFEFVFDPPLMLPSTGTYYFALQAVPCYGTWRLMAVSGTDYYSYGYAWLNGKIDLNQCPSLRPFPRSNTDADLCFRIRFCDSVTPTRQSSWGEIKARYR